MLKVIFTDVDALKEIPAGKNHVGSKKWSFYTVVVGEGCAMR